MSESNVKENYEIADYMHIIKGHAYVCYKKINKSSIIDFDDIVQEGCMIFVKSVRRHKLHKTGPFEAYLKGSLRKSLGHVVQKSYRTLPQSTRVEQEIDKPSSLNNPFEVLNLLFFQGELKPNELNLFNLLADPPQELIEELKRNRTQIKSILCKYIGIPAHQLRNMENNIKSFLSSI